MKEDRSIGPELAMSALDEIPEVKSDARDIVGLVKSSGRITGYQLSDGNTVSKEDGVAMAKNGEIKGVGIAHRNDSEYLKSLPDGDEGNSVFQFGNDGKEAFFKAFFADPAADFICGKGILTGQQMAHHLVITAVNFRKQFHLCFLLSDTSDTYPPNPGKTAVPQIWPYIPATEFFR